MSEDVPIGHIPRTMTVQACLFAQHCVQCPAQGDVMCIISLRATPYATDRSVQPSTVVSPPERPTLVGCAPAVSALPRGQVTRGGRAFWLHR